MNMCDVTLFFESYKTLSHCKLGKKKELREERLEMLKRKIIKEVRSKEERLALKSNRDTLDETQIILELSVKR